VSREMSNRGLVNASSGVDVHRVNDLVHGLGILFCLVLGLILPRWCEKEATVRGECEPAKERSERFIRVEIGVLHPQPQAGGNRMGLWRCFHRHHGWQRHGGCRRGGSPRGKRRSAAVAHHTGRVHGRGKRSRGAWGGWCWGPDRGVGVNHGHLSAMAKLRRCRAARRDSARRQIGFVVARNLGRLVLLCESIMPIFILQRVDVYRSIGRLSGYVLVQGIPSDSLDVVTVLSNLSHKRT
jgi:hypothetical protein